MSTTTAAGSFVKNGSGALGELQHNQQEPSLRSPRKLPEEGRDESSRGRSRSPTKIAISGFSLRPTLSREATKTDDAKSRESSPTKPKKTRSAANLGGLLSKPKSLKGLQKLVTDDEVRLSKDKENRTPDDSFSGDVATPIFAQFTNAPFRQNEGRASVDVSRTAQDQDMYSSGRAGAKERPKSFQVPLNNNAKYDYRPSPTRSRFSDDGSSRKSSKGSGTDRSTKSSRAKVFGAFTTFSSSRNKSVKTTTAPEAIEAVEHVLDPKDIDKHLEAMLDRRNIPENQRYKMRNLTDTIKMEFIRQDWAEMQANKSDQQPESPANNETGAAVAAASDSEEKPKRGRGKSFTLSRGKKESSSPTKKSKAEGTLGRHFRSKSTDNVGVSTDRPSSSSSTNHSLLSKIKLQQGPADYVAYMRKVQKPQSVEVGKIHKLRLLLRNETVSWIEDFIKQGGMMEIVGLLNRIMEVEWR